MTVLTTPADAQKFVDLITHNKDIPSNFLPLLNFYNTLKSRVRVSGKKVMDIVIFGKRFYYSIKGLSEEEYKRMIGRLAMYEFTVNYQDWPEFHTSQEKRTQQLEEAKKNLSLPSEKAHFTEEFLILGDQASDIMGPATLALMPLEDIRKKVKKSTKK